MSAVYYNILICIKWLVNFVGDFTYTFFRVRLFRFTYERMINAISPEAQKLILKEPMLKKRLQMLCNTVDHDVGCGMFAQIATYHRYKFFINQYAAIQDILVKEPEIRKVKIVKPVFLVNLPRTGSNLMGRLLSCDPQFVAPPTWEMGETDNLKGRGGTSDNFLYKLMPNSKIGHLHPFEPNNVDDGMVLLIRRVIDIYTLVQNPIFAESLWKESRENLRRDCEAMKEMLQIIIAHRNYDATEQRLMMKIHCNVFNLQAFLDVFPDAQIVIGHRNCSELVSSATSFMNKMAISTHNFQNMQYFAMQQNWFNARCGAELVKQKQKIIAERENNELPIDNLFLDYAYKDMVKDPMGTIQQLYTGLGMTFRPDVKQAMQTWLENNRQDKYGRHVYSLEQFGLTEDDVNREWAEYQEHFKQYI